MYRFQIQIRTRNPVGTINPGETKTLSFQVLVTQIPAGGVIANEASTTYTYQPDQQDRRLPQPNRQHLLQSPLIPLQLTLQNLLIVLSLILVMLLRIQLVYKITALFLNKYCTNRSNSKRYNIYSK